jgi:murein DD-endopeptidase MepM/ murein hydrolase activator NlpD
LIILPISGVKHTVKKGDTLASIAKKYKGDAEEIQSYNNMGAELAIGSVIIIPDGEIVAEPKKAAPKASVRLGASGVPSYSGFYQRPISGGVRTQGIHGFNGVDLAAPVGTPIYAAASGQVVISRSGAWNGGYGNYIVISHSNGTQTLYSHNSSNVVSQGETVAQGQVIGYVGNTGKSTGPHVHFEVRGAKNPF